MGLGDRPVVVVGAGIGGLVAATLLAARGVDVLVIEQASRPGGKIREVTIGGARIGAGPARLTLRPVFEAIFAEAGATLTDHLGLVPDHSLGRHLWSDGASLDLPAEAAAAEAAIGAFAGAAAARGYRDFRVRAKRIHDALEGPFLMAQRPGALGLAAQTGLRGLLGTSPFASLWDALGEHFPDARLRQVFGRVATYVGSSPLQAPATLMLVAHVEQQGLWRIEGGMIRLPEALEALARRHGARLRCQAKVRRILVSGGRASGVMLEDGETIAASAVLLNADPAALAEGHFGREAAGAAERLPPQRRSFSAITWAMRSEPGSIPAAHCVLHADDAVGEYAELGYRARLPARPTATVWAEGEGVLAMVSAPARTDSRPLPAETVAACGERVFAALRGVGVAMPDGERVVTTPADFDRMFPGAGGALYGPAAQGWQSAFARPGARTKLPGLYLAGGAVHPGAGVAMAAISGRLAAARIIEDRA